MSIFDYMQLPFARYALIAGVLVGLCAGLIGVPLVLKRYSMIGFGLSNVAFAGMAIGAVIGMTNSLFLVIPVTIVVSIVLLTSSKNSKLRGDSAIAMLSASTIAIGFFILNVRPVTGNVAGDVCNIMFGSSLLSLSNFDIILSITMAIGVVLFFIFFYNKIFAMTFDPEFAKATGVNSKVYEIFIAAVIAIVVAISIRIVGSLLVAALIIFPALSSMRVFKDFKMVVICSALLGMVCSVIGMLASIMMDTPVGATIVIANLVVFVVFYGAGIALKKK